MTTLRHPDYAAEPVFAFTTDLEWASEEAIADTFGLFDDYGVPLTPFVTHDSNAVREHFASPDLRPRVGIHPNFLPQSTHGGNEADVLDTASGLWPEARGFRSHGFFDNAHLTLALRQRGFHWDSNLPLFLQDQLVPLAHFSGLVRFPVFWDDYIHVHKGLPFDLREICSLFATPGLKVINVHPLHLALNTASPEQYRRSKSLPLNATRFEGSGLRTLLTQLLDFVRERSFPTEYLDDLFLDYDRSDGLARALQKRPWEQPRPSETQVTTSTVDKGSL